MLLERLVDNLRDGQAVQACTSRAWLLQTMTHPRGHDLMAHSVTIGLEHVNHRGGR